jgi:hypothetical protein
MIDRTVADSWVTRVLGFVVASSGLPISTAPAADAAALNERLQSAGRALRLLRDTAAPGSTDLAVRYSHAVTMAKEDPAAVVGLMDVRESDIARAASAARGRDAAPARGRGVAYRKLLLRWREAQSAVDANLLSLGKVLLARPDIQADPRIDSIRQAVAELPNLVPKFSGELEKVLDSGMNQDAPEESARLAAEGIKAVDAYRQQLATVSALAALEQFAAKDLGASLLLHAALDEALAELKQQLAT